VVRGSLRAATILEEWVGFETKKREVAAKVDNTDELHKLDLRQQYNAEESLRRDLAPTQRAKYEEVAAAHEKPAW
jgi:hypothetical protein